MTIAEEVEPFQIREFVLGELAHYELPYDPARMQSMFDDPETDEFLRFSIGATFALSKPVGICEWAFDRLLNTELVGRDALLLAVAKHCDKARAREAAHQMAKISPWGATDVLGKVGNHDSIAILEEAMKGVSCKETLRRMRKRVEQLERKFPNRA